MAASRDTARVASHYDAFAEKYDSSISVFERLFISDGRARVCGQASGDVLEIAVGTGRNLPFYPASVEFTGIDISPAMLERAQSFADVLGRSVDLRLGDAQALPFPDGRFDTVVSTLSMCTIPDIRRAIAEAERVLRPGGTFLLLEHVGSSNRIVKAIQRALDPLAVRLLCDHLIRQPAAAIRAQGFVIDELARSKLGIIERIVAVKTG